MHQFHKFILSWNSTCFGQLLCPSSGVYSLYTQQWYMSYRFADSFRAGPAWNIFHPGPVRQPYDIPLLIVQWINSWWWTDELSETCKVSCQNKFVKLVHLVGFIIKKFVTMRGHVNVKIWFVFFGILRRSVSQTCAYCQVIQALNVHQVCLLCN
jgi:hypothetical protein